MSEDLATYAVTRDPDLRGALAERHLPLVKFVARKMSRSLPAHMDLDDLVSWGSIGLLDAIDKFDPQREVRFSTYAVTRIRGAILDGLQQMDWAPKQVTSKVRAVRRVQELLIAELGCTPTPEQIAERIDIDVALVRRWLADDSALRVKPLEPGLGDAGEGGFTWELSVEAEQEVAGEVAEIRSYVAQAVGYLGARERAVFVLYYRDSMTLREIAQELGISVSSATQAHTRLVDQVRGRLAVLGTR